MPKLSIVTPCYYNADNLPITTQVFIENEANFPPDVEFEYVLVDDGSKDTTYAEMQKFQAKYPNKVRLVKLAGNVGSYNAILAGLEYCTGDVIAMLVADLQDPPELVPQMYDHWTKGIKFVIANRMDREESFSQKVFSNTYHKLIKKYALPQIPKGGFDLVLFDKALRDHVVEIQERNTNLIYLLSWLNYPYVSIPYVRKAREIGESRWTVRKKIKLFIDSFVSFSFMPIRVITVSGVIFGIAALLYALFIIMAKLFGWVPIEGWSALMVVVLTVSAFQMIGIGVLGEYLWRTLDAARKRPNYVVEEVKDISIPK